MRTSLCPFFSVKGTHFDLDSFDGIGLDSYSIDPQGNTLLVVAACTVSPAFIPVDSFITSRALTCYLFSMCPVVESCIRSFICGWRTRTYWMCCFFWLYPHCPQESSQEPVQVAGQSQVESPTSRPWRGCRITFLQAKNANPAQILIDAHRLQRHM